MVVYGGGITGGGTAVPSSLLPAAVLAVCTPWPLPSSASGFGPLQRPSTSVVVQSTALSSLWLLASKPQVGSSANEGCVELMPVSISPTTMPSPRVGML